MTRNFAGVYAIALALILGACKGTENKANKNEFADGPFLISWHYIADGVVFLPPTPRIQSSQPLRFKAGKMFDLVVNVRLRNTAKNPCIVKNACEVDAKLILTGGVKEFTLGEWKDENILSDGNDTFDISGGLSDNFAGSKGYIRFRINKHGRRINEFDTFPFVVVP